MSQFELLNTRRFWPLFWTQFLGAFNDNFLKNALVILITFRAGTVAGIPSSQMVPVAAGVFILPFFLFSATAGQLADKYEKSRIIRLVKLAEILIMILAAIGFISHHYLFSLLVLFLMGLHSTFFGPLKYSILPQLLKPDELVGGNALVEAGTFLAILLGTILGGILIILPRGEYWVSSGLMALALLGWFTSRFVPRSESSDHKLRVQWNPWTPTADILKKTRKNPMVFLSLLGISWFWFLGAGLLSLFPSYVRDVLHAEAQVVTLFLALFSIGVGTGSLLCEVFSRKKLELGLVPLGTLGMSLFILDLWVIGSPSFVSATLASPTGIQTLISSGSGWRIMIDLFLLSVFSGFYTVPLYTLIQERSEPQFRSRTIAANNILNALYMVLASILLILLDRWGFSIPQVFGLLALLNILASLYIYLRLPEFLSRFLAFLRLS